MSASSIRMNKYRVFIDLPHLFLQFGVDLLARIHSS